MFRTLLCCVLLAAFAFPVHAQDKTVAVDLVAYPTFPLVSGDIVPIKATVSTGPGENVTPLALAVLIKSSGAGRLLTKPPAGTTIFLPADIEGPPDADGEATSTTPSIGPRINEEGYFEAYWVTPPQASFTFWVYLEIYAYRLAKLDLDYFASHRFGDIQHDTPVKRFSDYWKTSRHSADTMDAPWVISISELLRVIQFYNYKNNFGLSLSCDSGSEDGYRPGGGTYDCIPHDLDYNPQDWLISLSELLRLIQFYNVGGYAPNLDGEDFFAPEFTAYFGSAKEFLGIGKTIELSSYRYDGEIPGRIRLLTDSFVYLGEAEFLGFKEDARDHYRYTSPGGYTGAVVLEIDVTDRSGKQFTRTQLNNFIMDSTPPSVAITGPFLAEEIRPFFRVQAFGAFNPNLSTADIGMVKSGTGNCGLDVIAEDAANGLFKVYLDNCAEPGSLQIFVKPNTLSDLAGNLNSQSAYSAVYTILTGINAQILVSLHAESAFFQAGRPSLLTLDLRAVPGKTGFTNLGTALTLPSDWVLGAVEPANRVSSFTPDGNIVFTGNAPLPLQVACTINTSADSAAAVTLGATANYLKNGYPGLTYTNTLALARGPDLRWHTADINKDNLISVSEILRVIQFYNGDGFHCEPGSEDGFAVGQGEENCYPHNGDYDKQDWTFNIYELLRIVQLQTGYHADPTSEDGFAFGLLDQ